MMEYEGRHFLKEYLEVGGGYKKLAEATHLNTVATKSDPEDEPYKSKYAARQIWNETRAEIQTHSDSAEIFDDFVRCVIAVLNYHVGVNYVETEELQSGEELLKKTLDSVRELKLNKIGYSIYIKTLNQLGILCSIRAKHEDALNYLIEAVNLYDEYKYEMVAIPWRIDELTSKRDDTVGTVKERSTEMEDSYTHTLYYIAQVHANLGQRKESAYYCNVTLKRQLESKTYDAKDWAVNAATLSQYFILEKNFSVARHFLASSSLIFSDVLDNMSEELQEDVIEDINKEKADIDRCWVKYGLALLEASQEKLVKEVEDMDSDRSTCAVDNAVNEVLHESGNNESSDVDSAAFNNDGTAAVNNDGDTKALMFDLELTQYEERVTCNYVLDFSDARKIFLIVQQWVKSAQDFYTINERCSDYIELVQDYSRAYKLLSFFEVNMDRQCCMEKRRVDLLTNLLNELNPQCYMLVCRQLMFELAETYSSIMDLKFALVEISNTQPLAHDLNKINSLARNGINQYNAYLDSLKGGKPDLPEQFPENDVRPALVAMFCIGRLHGKLLTKDRQEKIANVRRSLESFAFVVKYCKDNPKAVDLVPTELSVANEMAVLLPLKIERLQTCSLNDF